MKKNVRSLEGANAPSRFSFPPLLQIIFKMLGLALVDAFAIWFLYILAADGVWLLFAVLLLITLGLNIVFLNNKLLPMRWLSPGLALMILMVLYPLVFTVYTAFTNYSDGHLLTKQQSINLIEKQQYLPTGADTYSWTAFRSPSGDFLLWLISDKGEPLLVQVDEPPQDGNGNISGVGAFDEEGIPLSIQGYQRLTRAEAIRYISELGNLEFGIAPDTFKIKSMDVVAQFQQKYTYHADSDVFVDNETGKIYRPVEGTFTASDGSTLTPGFQITIGWENFRKLITSPALSGPLVTIFIWTLAFAVLSVLLTFGLGLFLAVLFDGLQLHKKKILRSLLIIPYTIPGFISILIWVGLFNPHLGVISLSLEEWFGWSPAWFSDPFWAKVGILIVNLWLGYPYMMLVSSGALQSIPHEILEAARVDGANSWQCFWKITMPLLLMSVGPLLISSFAMNFNNFTVIYLYNSGGPPIPGTSTPAGYTDILISYTYRLAFASGRGSDYGYASAITIIIFIVVAAITLFNFRFTRVWEEVSENV
jgi:ABC-type sugar transport system permease subunit